MSVLDFKKPVKLLPTAVWNDNHQSDSDIAGTYVPNMSEADKLKWKAKRIVGSDPRVEIRKTISNHGDYAQMLVIVRKDEVVISGNGRMNFSQENWNDLFDAVAEAKALLT